MKKITSLFLMSLLGLGTPVQAGDNVEVGSVYFIRTAGTGNTVGHYLGEHRKSGTPDVCLGFTDIPNANANGNQASGAYTFLVEAGTTEGTYRIKCLDKNKYLKYTMTKYDGTSGHAVELTETLENTEWKIIDNIGNTAQGETNAKDIVPGSLNPTADNDVAAWNPHGGWNTTQPQPDLGFWSHKDNASAWVFEKVMKLSTLTDNAFGNDMHWYALEIQRAGDLKYAKNSGDVNNNETKNRTTDPAWSDNHLYAFVANTNGGVDIYSKTAGAGKILMDSRTDNGDITMRASGNDAWTILKCKNGEDNGFVFKKRGSTNGYLHDYNGKLGFWFSDQATSDVGSFIKPVSFSDAEKNMAKRDLKAIKDKWVSHVPAIYGAYNHEATVAKIDALTGEPANVRIAATGVINDNFWKLIDGKTFILKNNGDKGRDQLYMTPDNNADSRGIYGQNQLKDNLEFTFKYANANTFYVYNAATKTYFSGIGQLRADNVKSAYFFELGTAETLSRPNMIAMTISGTTSTVHQADNSQNHSIVDWRDLADAATIWTLIDSKTLIPNFITEAQRLQGCVGGFTAEQTQQLSQVKTFEQLNPWMTTARIAFDNNKYYHLKSGLFAYNPAKGIYVDGDALKWKAFDAADETFIWKVVAKEGGKYTIQNASNLKYIVGTTVGVAPADVTLTSLGTGSYNITVGEKVLHTQGHSGGTGNSGDIVGYPGGYNTGSAWLFEECAAPKIDPAVAAQTNLRNLVNDLKAKYYDAWSNNWRVGNAINCFVQPDGDKDFVETLTGAETLVNGELTTVEIYNSKAEELNTLVSHMTIFQPLQNKFYYLRCTEGGKYLHSTLAEGSRKLLMGDKSNLNLADVTFLYTADGLESYVNGQYLGMFESNTVREFLSVGSAKAVTFTAAGNGAVGPYNVNIKDGDTNNFLYGKNAQLDKGGSVGTDHGYNWWLEEAKVLPIKFNADATAAYATIYAPVALLCPEGITAYTGVKNGNSLTLTAISDGVIPAGTGVLLKGVVDKAGIQNFTIVANAEALTVKNDFIGNYASKNGADGTNYYVLGKGSKTTDVIGFYSHTGATNKVVKGFRARLAKDAVTTTNALRMIFDGDDVTGIEGVVEEMNENSEIYDLSGRRVAVPSKGLYIINGKKVYVK